MAQPSVVREPSMEEILASIRQIIESNEPGAGRAISPSLPPVYGADDEESDSNIHLTVDETYADVEFPEPMMPSDPRFVAANSAGSREAEAPSRAMSLADVAARVRAASERTTPQPQREAPPVFRQPEPVGRLEQETHRPVEAHSTPAVAPPLAVMPAPAVAQAERVEMPQPTVAEPAPQPQAVVPPAIASAESRLPGVGGEAQGLISQSAGQQIARSFEELALAIDGAERRSLDEIAEDMLRPMLREWLDDNLPTLVERLVREEIERVARGPRR
ncbi:DUF2497 domain-containing protein [Rhizobium sullae]|uniref:DUF2497 domain-containing protein n=1 Tax=Rhizobium sullae TaxID=50338 RepID=A0A2N0D119_RHISU|nr:DUF2497 domain-containing protein [Rhizobium sullae]PKA39814.1 DUF2497 domain-containing protein [Rhizobium sullae]UWU16243.1 DUF2497 domain-containing protein [Rhizobium sullae]